MILFKYVFCLKMHQIAQLHGTAHHAVIPALVTVHAYNSATLPRALL